MTRPRKALISLTDTPYYHITSRCGSCAGWMFNRVRITNIYDKGSSIAFSLKQAVQIQLLCVDLLDFKTPLKPPHQFESCQVNHLGNSGYRIPIFRKLTYHPKVLVSVYREKSQPAGCPVCPHIRDPRYGNLSVRSLRFLAVKRAGA
jgi:hypothetical protein